MGSLPVREMFSDLLIVVKEGRILHLFSGCRKLEVTIDNHVTYFTSGLIWSVLGHFIGVEKEKVGGR